ncbi:hypothetical protein GQ43DRAFT_426059 [Delitschia confertaspora ATCC 74209]|uniref:Stress-response A/B barrel domain-containing protein n=1 Tax=Delitschia confertaspora ATCC 74209 TaxID=1513339 RepID=A0A9P4MR71_9PLEO|nr:hypothetical protein GQ43DRAFT_426059 [Delitschia confertaspora ATCC 74209]
MTVTHIVLFQFKKDATAEDVSTISRLTLALKNDCIHPKTNKPYIKSASGGTDNSPEGIQNGITHAFIMEFETEADRDYYLFKDPAHDAFKKLAGRVLEKVQAVDFTDGVFKS